MTVSEPLKWRRPNAEELELSARDRSLERVQKLLDEPLVIPFSEDWSETHQADENNEVPNLDALVEVARLPHGDNAKRSPVTPLITPAVEFTTKKNSPLHMLLQVFLLSFVLVSVFLFGVLIGRNQVFNYGLLNDLMTWFEEKTVDEPAPPIVLVESALTAEQRVASSSDLPLDNQIQPTDEILSAAALPGNSFSPIVTESVNEEEWQVSPFSPTEEDNAAVSPNPALAAAAPVANTAGEATTERTEQSAAMVPLATRHWAGQRWFQDEAARRRQEMVEALNLENEAAAAEEAAFVAARAKVSDKPRNEALMAETPSTTPSPSAPDGAAPQTVQAAAPTVTEDVASVEEGKFAVQVALVYDEAEAQRRVDRLARQGFKAYYYQNNSGRLPVRVGRFLTKEEAAEAKMRLETLGYSGPYVSQLE